MNFFFILCIVAALELCWVQARRHKTHKRAKSIRRIKKSTFEPPSEGEIRNGKYERQGYTWKFSCEWGHSLVGLETIKFFPENETWSGSLPGCKSNGALKVDHGYYEDGIQNNLQGLLMCYQPYFVDGGQFYSTSVAYGNITLLDARCRMQVYRDNFENGYYEKYSDDIITITKYYCHDDYQLQGKSEFMYPTYPISSSSVNYEIKPPQCISSAGKGIKNGFYVRSDYRWYFFCNDGYILDGPNSISYDPENDKWTGSMPGCRPDISEPMNHGFTVKDTQHNRSRVECYRPYTFYGSQFIHATYVSLDSDKSHICQMPRYKEGFRFGYLEEFKNDIMSSTKYFCKMGYKIKGGRSEFVFPTFELASFVAKYSPEVPYCVRDRIYSRRRRASHAKRLSRRH